MSITKDNKEMVAAYRGQQPISHIYRGDRLIYRMEPDTVLKWTVDAETDERFGYNIWYSPNGISEERINVKSQLDIGTLITESYLVRVKPRSIKFNRYYTSGSSTIWYPNTSLEEVIKLPIDSRMTSFPFFRKCTALKKINMNDWDCSNITTGGVWYDCTSLTTITGNLRNYKVTTNMSECPLTRESVLVLIDGLADVGASRQLTISKASYQSLTAEDISIATSKGWTIAS